MPEKTVTVGSSIGLHARPAAIIAEAVVNAGVEVTLAVDGGEPVDAGSALMIMTLGGPYNSSTVLAYYMYEQTFLALRYGYGAAIAVVLLALMSGIILVLLWRLFRREVSRRA